MQRNHTCITRRSRVPESRFSQRTHSQTRPEPPGGANQKMWTPPELPLQRVAYLPGFSHHTRTTPHPLAPRPLFARRTSLVGQQTPGGLGTSFRGSEGQYWGPKWRRAREAHPVSDASTKISLSLYGVRKALAALHAFRCGTPAASSAGQAAFTYLFVPFCSPLPGKNARFTRVFPSFLQKFHFPHGPKNRSVWLEPKTLTK